MDITLKQRLIGAAVIIALAVIFIPMLLEGPKETDPVSMKIEIPEKPVYEIPNRLGVAPAIPAPPAPESALKAPEVVIPEKPASSETAPPQIAIETPVKKEIVIEKPVEPPVAVVAPAVKPTPKPKSASKRVTISDSGFVVQVGSFSQRQNAMVLSDKLEAAGFPAFVESGKNKDKTIFRVKVGPQATRSDADKLRQKILESEKLKGIIVAHP